MNSAFKAMLEKDLENTFFNDSEFSDQHTIDGKEMSVLFDKSELLKRDPSGTKDSDGLYTDSLLIFVPVKEFGAKPKFGRQINLDGKRFYKIQNVDVQDGMYVLTLEAFRT